MNGMDGAEKRFGALFLSTILFDCLCIFSIFMDNKNVGVNQVIPLKEEPSFGYSYVKV